MKLPMNLISIITPVHMPTAQYLPTTWESLQAQNLPNGWRWEWIVQEDGQTGSLSELLPADDHRISIGSGRHGGPGVARNLALSRARGDLIKVLDADDILTEGALSRDIDALTTNTDVGWTTCRLLDLMPDGSTVGFPYDPPEGRLKSGAVLDHWRAHNYRAPVHPATLAMRRDLVLALGGWMALPASEDTGLLIAADSVTDGWFISEPGLLYRKWPGQATAQAAHTESSEWLARMHLIDERARCLAKSTITL
jgi:glycosyltransferase involved in cell wall biosynthesis